MNKSPDAFRTISEVAEDLDLPQHVLRFWETRFSSIRPLKRGGGRRYYRPDDVDLLKGIRHLLYGQGYTIKGVQRILKEGGLRYVQGIGRGEQVPAAPSGPDIDDFGPPDDDPGEDVDSRPGDPGPALLELAPAPARMPAPRPVAAGEPVFAHAARDRLRAVLLELEECQRLLDGLRRDP